MVNKGMTMQGLSLVVIGVLTLVVLYTIIPVVGSQIDQAITIPGSVAATGTLTFSGNVTCGELVNVTNVAGQLAVFEFNITDEPSCGAKITAYDDVVLARYQNTSAIAAWNLTTALNLNTTVNATMAATNNSNGVVTLTYSTNGSTGNSVATTEQSTNGAWGAATLTGGDDGSQWNSDVNTAIPTAPDLWEALGGILKVAGVIVIVGGLLQTFRGLRA